MCPLLKEALAKKYVPETGRREYPVGLGGRPASSGKGEKNHGKLSLQNESIARKANGGAWMIRERTLPLKGRSVKLVYIARRDNSSTKGESEVKGVFGVGYG